MGTTVQKYGGSSLATEDQIAGIARRLAAEHHRGTTLLVVVSARGKTTDDLVRAAASVSSAPDPTETDKLLATGELAAAALLAIALRERGVPAVSLSGPEAGLRAIGRHGAGVVETVDTRPTRDWLDRGQLVVVAGFQACNGDGEVITLGRGGSDTSAVALAVSHGARVCEIYTDVDGVRCADPRIVPGAPLLAEVDAGVMVEMSFSGARVMHPRAVELAAAHGVDIVVRHSSGRGRGTVIQSGVIRSGAILGGKPAMPDDSTIEGRAGVVAVTHDPAIAQVVVRAAAEHTPCGIGVLDALADRQIAVDPVVWWSLPPEELRMTFCVPESTVDEVMATVGTALEAHGGVAEIHHPVGKVSIVGVGLLSRPKISASALAVLASQGIDVRCVSCTQARTTVVVDRDRVHDAVKVLCREFGLDRTAGSEAVLSPATPAQTR
jgi:aspartate kinase